MATRPGNCLFCARGTCAGSRALGETLAEGMLIGKPDSTTFPDHALSDDTQPPAQHFLDFGRRQGRTEKETLHLVAAFRAQQRQLLGGLDAFRGRRYSETPAESGNGAHDRHQFAAGRKLADKGPVDLDLVERKTPQIAQR